MKKKISLLLAILMLVTLIPTAFAESKTVDAVKNTKKITLDGEEVMVGAYDVEGYNYLKLRDVAAILNTKKCQFNVGFDGPTKLITVELAKAYEKVEGDLAEIKDEKAKAIVSVKKILVNGEEKEIKTALINEYNYMQLRDLASLVGLDVKYDAKNKVIMLKSDAQAKEEEKTDGKTEEKKDDKKEDKKEEKKDEKKEDKKDKKVDEKKDDDAEVVDQEEQALLDEQADRDYSEFTLNLFKKADALHDAMAAEDYEKASDAVFDIVNARYDAEAIKKDRDKTVGFAKKINADIFKKDYKARGNAFIYSDKYEFIREYDYGNNSLTELVITYHLDGGYYSIRYSPIKRLTDKTYENLSQKDKDNFKLLDSFYEPLIKGETEKLDNALNKYLQVSDKSIATLVEHTKQKLELYKADTSKVVKVVRLMQETLDGTEYHIMYRYANKTYTIITLYDHKDGKNFLTNVIKVSKDK